MIPTPVKARANPGKHIPLLDRYGTFTGNTKYKTAYFKSTDDLHPADVWYAGIQSFLR
jgi:hypothetical protein